MNGRDIIHPRERFSCITSVLGFKFARFDDTDSNVRKRPFSFGRALQTACRPPDSLDVKRPALPEDWLGRLQK